MVDPVPTSSGVIIRLLMVLIPLTLNFCAVKSVVVVTPRVEIPAKFQLVP